MPEATILTQMVIPYLRALGYRLIRTDLSLGVGSRRVRADAIAYDARNQPIILVVVKRTLADLPDRIEPYDAQVRQAFRDALMTEVPYFLISDGRRFLWFRVDLARGLPEQIDTPPRSETHSTGLLPFQSVEDVRQVLKSVLNILYGNVGLSRERIAQELLGLLWAKIADEKRMAMGHTPEFFVDSVGSAIEVKKRLQGLYERENPGGGTLSEEIPLDIWLTVATTLEPFSLLRTDLKTLLKGLDIVLASEFRTSKGQFMTPQVLVDFMVSLVNPTPNERMLDPVCGTGRLLTSTLAFQTSQESLAQAANNTYGIDYDLLLVEVARLAVAIAGGRPENIRRGNSLDQTELDSVGIAPESFDIIMAHPPVGGIGVDDPAILNQYELTQRRHKGRSLRRQDKTVLFLERCFQLLKPGGRMAIVVPEGLLVSPQYRFVREWLIMRSHLKAVISLPTETFPPTASIKSDLLVLAKTAVGNDCRVFMATVEDMGHDRDGHPTDSNDLLAIAEQYDQFLKLAHQVKTGKTWDVPQNQQLVERLDPIFHHPEHQRMAHDLKQLGFPLIQLGEVCEAFITGTMVTTSMTESVGVAVVGVPQLHDGKLDLTNARRVATGLAQAELQKYTLKPGDLLVSSQGKLGEIAVVAQTDLPAIVGRGVILVRVKPGTVDPRILQMFFASDWMRRQIHARARQDPIPSIRLDDWKSLLVPIPDTETQAVIVERLEKADELRRQADLLEQQAFTTLKVLSGGRSDDAS